MTLNTESLESDTFLCLGRSGLRRFLKEWRVFYIYILPKIVVLSDGAIVQISVDKNRVNVDDWNGRKTPFLGSLQPPSS